MWKQLMLHHNTNILQTIVFFVWSVTIWLTPDLSQEPGSEEAEKDSVVGLTVEPRHSDGEVLP